jgi:uncharacterized protein
MPSPRPDPLHLQPRRRRPAAAGLLLVALCFAAAAHAADPADLGSPRGYLTDAAQALQPAAAQQIEAYLTRVDQQLHVQVAVVLVPSTKPLAIEEYAVKLFERWGIGGTEKDEGLLLLVAV